LCVAGKGAISPEGNARLRSVKNEGRGSLPIKVTYTAEETIKEGEEDLNSPRFTEDKFISMGRGGNAKWGRKELQGESHSER